MKYFGISQSDPFVDGTISCLVWHVKNKTAVSIFSKWEKSAQLLFPDRLRCQFIVRPEGQTVVDSTLFEASKHLSLYTIAC